MELYIGGHAQNKLTYVLQHKGELPVIWAHEQFLKYQPNQEIIFCRFHEWFLKRIKQGGNPEEEMGQMCKVYSKLSIICNEVGNGIVPIESMEREYRERLGRYLCELAQRAERVERIFCGIGQRIK